MNIQLQLFSNNLYTQTRTGVEHTRISGRQCFWVVSRSCCVFRRLDFSHVPAAKRNAALLQRIPLDSPFAQSGYWVDWQDGIANLWLWDRVLHDNLRSQVQDADNRAIKVIPESAYTQKIQQGSQLWKSAEGYIGQCWQDHQLLGESWWPDHPSASRWNDFLKSLGQAADKTPEVLQLEFTIGAQWKGQQFGRLSLSSERTIMVSALALFSLIIIFQLVGLGRLTVNNLSLQRDIRTLQPEIEKTIALRDRFFELRNQNLQYASLSGLRQLDMMADIADVLGSMGATLAEWHFQENALDMTVTDKSPDLNQYVEKLEALGWLSAIRIDKSANKSQIVIRSELLVSL